VWTGGCGNVLIFTGYQKTLMGITLVSSPISFFVALLLVQSRGTMGVALAMAGGLALQNLAAWWFVHRRVGIWTHVSPDIPGLFNIFRDVIRYRRQ
jgi:O-antigen/teichoic acid export membrane protein